MCGTVKTTDSVKKPEPATARALIILITYGRKGWMAPGMQRIATASNKEKMSTYSFA